MSTGGKPASRRLGDPATLEAVKRIADCDEVEVAIGLDVLRASHHPANVVNSASTSVGAREIDGLGLLIDGANLGETRGETERKLARATRKVEQPSLACRVRPAAQVIQQRRRVRHSEPVVEVRRPSIQIGTELGLDFHSPIIAPEQWFHAPGCQDQRMTACRAASRTSSPLMTTLVSSMPASAHSANTSSGPGVGSGKTQYSKRK